MQTETNNIIANQTKQKQVNHPNPPTKSQHNINPTCSLLPKLTVHYSWLT